MYEVQLPYTQEVWNALENEPLRVESDIRRRAGEGQIFSCMFIKKTNKHFRQMVARLGVPYSDGSEPRDWDPGDHQLMQVFDMQKSAYRFINLPKTVWVKAGGDLLIYNQSAILDYPELIPSK